MNKTILGLDLGSNSIGWALLHETDGEMGQIIDLGSRIFTKAVEEKIPTPKNQKRRNMRLGRRVLQRRARRKQRMANYLISLDLLPATLHNNFGQEKLLNELGDPYELRVKGLDAQLTPYEFGRVLLHFVARRGFFSSKKQIAGDLVDDPDTQDYLASLDNKPTKDKEEGQFKADIAQVYQAINNDNARTLGEYLFNFEVGEAKRNRAHDGGHLRTDRAMYQDELAQIWQHQAQFFSHLPADFMQKNKGVLKIIFYQRPLKLRKDRVGICSFELQHYRANVARLEVQQFRYLQDINNLSYFERHSEQWIFLNEAQKSKLRFYFEHHPKITVSALKKILGLDRFNTLNLEAKNLKGNVTACDIRAVIGKIWDDFSAVQQQQLFEDLFTFEKKSALKKRLMTHWNFGADIAIKLCLIEFEPGHSSLSLKAIKKILPFLKQGLIYSKNDTETGEIGALQAAGYQAEKSTTDPLETLRAPVETSNPIVNRALHELRRVVNALIKTHGKPDGVRIEMARDLEMNTQRYKDNEKFQKDNRKINEAAELEFIQHNSGKKFATKDDKLRYKLWQEQDQCCVYSGDTISITELWGSSVEIDHIVPRSLCLDDSYTNKVLCKISENRFKARKTPIDTWGADEEKWHQITQRIERFYPERAYKKYRKSAAHPKKKQFYMRQADISKKYGMSGAQLTDTRYISRLSQTYLAELGCDVSTTKGAIVAEVRRQWGLNSIIGQTNKKERTDHRHHAIDAVVIGHLNRSFHNRMTQTIKQSENTGEHFHLTPPYPNFRTETKAKIAQIIVSHAPQRKLSGALHEETGAGLVKKHGGLVYRKLLSPDFTIKNAMSIVDEPLKTLILEHIENHGNCKTAFNEENLRTLKLGKNPIKRVRVLQSVIKTTKKQTAEDVLANTKFGVRDKSGKIFKYMSFGNTHHVEIIQHVKTGKVRGEFVTMMAASQRAKGINISKQPMIKTDHGEDWQFLMALHINDTVSIENSDGERAFYRVQKIGGGYDITLRLHTASTLKNKDESLGLMAKGIVENNLIKHRVNAIGGLIDD